jgi:hypothetical protein
MPVTFTCFAITAASISGVPPFNGFFSKELVYDAALERGSYFLSERRGQYCSKSGEPNNWVTGTASGKSYDCTPGIGSENKDEKKKEIIQFI